LEERKILVHSNRIKVVWKSTKWA